MWYETGILWDLCNRTIDSPWLATRVIYWVSFTSSPVHHLNRAPPFPLSTCLQYCVIIGCDMSTIDSKKTINHVDNTDKQGGTMQYSLRYRYNPWVAATSTTQTLCHYLLATDKFSSFILKLLKALLDLHNPTNHVITSWNKTNSKCFPDDLSSWGVSGRKWY